MDEKTKLLSLLQISDSGFPTGGFSHSAGLEAAINIHSVIDKDSLKTFLLCSLENCASFMLPFMKEAYNLSTDTQGLSKLDELCEASIPNHVAKRASTRQGRSLFDTSLRVFHMPLLDIMNRSLSYKHYPVVYGIVCVSLDIPLSAAITAFLYTALRTVIASCVRLDKLGPIEAQSIQLAIQTDIPAVIERHKQRVSQDACMMFPHIDIIQNLHDTMFSKLFYS